jgi:hypothetical protein
MSTNAAVEGKGEKSVSICTAGWKTQHYTVMLRITVGRRKLPLYVIFERKTMPNENLPNDVQFGVNHLAHRFSYHICLCGIFFTGI